MPLDAPDVPDVFDAPASEPCAEPMGCAGPRVTCSAGVTTTAGVEVALAATAAADPLSRIVSERWAVTATPAGATGRLSTPTGRETRFSGDSAGAYGVRFTATDGAGRSASCDVPVRVAPTYRGTDFWAVSTANSGLVGGDVFRFAVVVGNSNDAPVTATVTGGGLAQPLAFTIPPRSAVAQALPWVTALSFNRGVISAPTPACCDSQCCQQTGACRFSIDSYARSGLVRGGAYHIATSAPVSVYQFNPQEFSSTALCASGTNSYSSDASLLLPTQALTGQYLVLAHNAFDALGSFVAITATRAGETTVRVTSSANLTAGDGVAPVRRGETVEYSLRQGDVLQLVSEGQTDTLGFGPEDLTGTRVEASGPVSVIAGVDCTYMSFPDGTEGACDHIEEQLFPVETWGREVVVSQLRDRGPSERYMVRVMSAEDGNLVTFTPAVRAPATLARGAFVEFESARDVAITATRPILVGQYMEGQETTPGALFGDPAFVLEVPTSQFRREYTVAVPATYVANFIHAVARAGTIINVDGQPLPGGGVTVEGTPWRVFRASIAPGSHRITSVGGEPFGLKLLGVAPYTSYAYPGGLDLQLAGP